MASIELWIQWCNAHGPIQVHPVMSENQFHCTRLWKPFWLATRLYPQNDCAGWQIGVNDDVYPHAPFDSLKVDMSILLPEGKASTANVLTNTAGWGQYHEYDKGNVITNNAAGRGTSNNSLRQPWLLWRRDHHMFLQCLASYDCLFLVPIFWNLKHSMLNIPLTTCQNGTNLNVFFPHPFVKPNWVVELLHDWVKSPTEPSSPQLASLEAQSTTKSLRPKKPFEATHSPEA